MKFFLKVISKDFKTSYELMNCHASHKQQALSFYENSNKIYKNHRFYFLHQTSLKAEINALFESLYQSQNTFQIILFFILKILSFSPKLMFFNPIKSIRDYWNGMITDVKYSYDNMNTLLLDTFQSIKFISRFFLFVLIFYAVFLLIFALNTFHLKEIGLLVVVFFLIYKLVKI